MSVRLTRGEYWLLTQAVRFKLPLSLIALPEGPPWDVNTIDMALNCQGHGMGFDELAQTLHELAERGWIALQRCHEKPRRCLGIWRRSAPNWASPGRISAALTMASPPRVATRGSNSRDRNGIGSSSTNTTMFTKSMQAECSAIPKIRSNGAQCM